MGGPLRASSTFSDIERSRITSENIEVAIDSTVGPGNSGDLKTLTKY